MKMGASKDTVNLGHLLRKTEHLEAGGRGIIVL